MTVRWEELTAEERVTLVALSQSPVLTLTVAMAARLELAGGNWDGRALAFKRVRLPLYA